MYKEVLKDFILNNPFVSLNPVTVLSNEVRSRYIGPSFQIDVDARDENTETGYWYLCHELSHFVEIESHRLLQPNGGLTFDGHKKATKMGASLRELRVVAYHINLMRSYNFSHQEEHTILGFPAIIAQEYPDQEFIPGITYEQKKEFLTETLNSYLKIYTVEKFHAEWNKKMEFLASLNETECLAA